MCVCVVPCDSAVCGFINLKPDLAGIFVLKKRGAIIVIGMQAREERKAHHEKAYSLSIALHSR